MSSERFFNNLKNLYGEDIFKQIKIYENVSRKKTCRLCDLVFLKRCRDKAVIPNFLRLKCHFDSNQAKRILYNTSKILLKERIHYIRKELASLDGRLNEIIFSLNSMDEEHWVILNEIIQRRNKNLHDSVSSKQKSKFDRLYNKQHPKQTSNTFEINKLVINLSNELLSDSALSVLSKGLDFAITPQRIPVEDIVTAVESAVQRLPEKEAEEVRVETAKILKKFRPPKNNLPKNELRALKELRNNEELIILPADKGKATVVMNKDDYIHKANLILEDNAYIKVKKNPLGSIKYQTTKLLKESSLDKDIIKKLIPQDPYVPRFYGLPKVHKKDVPLRPIVNCINSCTYDLSKYLDNLIRPYIGNSSSYVKNSKHFIEIIKNKHISSEDLLVSFDVTSLFTKIPIKDTLKLLEKNFSEDIVKLFRHCLTSSFFIFNNEFYKQVDGVAMGNPLSPSIANYYMESFEELALDSSTMKPSLWLRYVDDVFAIWPHGRQKLSIFLNHLNNIHENIKFTVEVEENGIIPFLDVLLERKEDGSLLHSVYRKPTHTNQYINANSHHHPSQKYGTIKCLMRRASEICHSEKLEEEMKEIKNIFMKNGFSKSSIEKCLKPKRPINNANERDVLFASLPYVKNVTDKIGRILRKKNMKISFSPYLKIRHMLRQVKDVIPLQSSGIYQIPCVCGKVYIGQTGRTISTRLNEHQRSIRLNQPEKSSVAEHALEEFHRIQFQDTKILARPKHLNSRLIREAIEIFKTKSKNLNHCDGQDLSRAWLPILNMLLSP